VEEDVGGGLIVGRDIAAKFNLGLEDGALHVCGL